MTESRTLRIGTRGSKLATTQAEGIKEELEKLGYTAELVIVKTPGDESQADGTPVEQVGVGVFTETLRNSLTNNECDIAVHSFKDLPTAPDARFQLVVPHRVSSREVLVSTDEQTLDSLKPGAKVGTSAPRRVSQLRSIRSDLDIQPIRGNIDTRIRRVGKDLDAVILARAGLERLGYLDKASQIINPTVIMPAPAQGALAVEIRADDSFACDAVKPLDDTSSHARAIAERAVLATLEAGCTAPIAAYSMIEGDSLILRAGVFALDGTESLNSTSTVKLGAVDSEQDSDIEQIYTRAHTLGTVVAKELLNRGAADLMQ